MRNDFHREMQLQAKLRVVQSLVGIFASVSNLCFTFRHLIYVRVSETGK
jgi:hypothetical protein